MKQGLVALGIIAGLFVAVDQASADHTNAPGGEPRLAACRYEDGSGQKQTCVWDALHRGNGEGKSFVSITPRDGGDDVRVRISHRRAYRLAD